MGSTFSVKAVLGDEKFLLEKGECREWETYIWNEWGVKKSSLGCGFDWQYFVKKKLNGRITFVVKTLIL